MTNEDGVPGAAKVGATAVLVAALCVASWPVRAAEAGDGVANAFGRDSEVTLDLRSYYFDRRNPGDVQNAAWTGGGWLGYRTGWIGDVLRLGLVGYTSQPFWAPSDTDGSGLLAPGQRAYSVLGEAYGQLKFADQLLTLGRFGVSQPEISASDIRMTPITYQGGSLAGTLAGAEYYVAYLSAEKQRNLEHFIDFAQAANISGGAKEPLWLIGFTGAPQKDLNLRLSSYYVPNVLSSTYADVAWLKPLADGVKLRLGGQLMSQTSVGEKLLTGSAFSTTSTGIKADLLPGAATLTVAYQQNGTGSKYNTPYSSWAGYTSMIVKDFNLAGEKAWLIGAAYDFAGLNAPGFVLNGNIVHGFDAIDAATRAALPSRTEYDITADYRFSALSWPEWARPLWIRARAAYVDQGANGVINDYRVILNYEWVFK